LVPWIVKRRESGHVVSTGEQSFTLLGVLYPRLCQSYQNQPGQMFHSSVTFDFVVVAVVDHVMAIMRLAAARRMSENCVRLEWNACS